MSGSNVQSQQDSPDSGHDVPAGQHGPHLAWQGLMSICVPSVNPENDGGNGNGFNGWKVHMFLSSRSVPVEKTPCRPVWCYVYLCCGPSLRSGLAVNCSHCPWRNMIEIEICLDLNWIWKILKVFITFPTTDRSSQDCLKSSVLLSFSGSPLHASACQYGRLNSQMGLLLTSKLLTQLNQSGLSP